MRVDHTYYLKKTTFRAHTFLTDVPLHDLWAIMLHTRGPKRNIQDVQRVFAAIRAQKIDPMVSLLFRVRSRLGRLFRWDLGHDETTALSYLHRLSDDDRKRTLQTPDRVDEAAGFRLLYAFENEALLEVINNTAHTFVLIAMEPVAEGYIMYLAIYVKKRSWLTALYMALIDPIRRYIIYPAMIHDFEQAWADIYAKPPQTARRRR